MNIDYEAIAEKAYEKTRHCGSHVAYVKAIIEAYEAQNKASEWVPLDLETVKPGQEVRHMNWRPGYARKFVGHYNDGIVSASDTEAFEWYLYRGQPWLMRTADKR